MPDYNSISLRRLETPITEYDEFKLVEHYLSAVVPADVLNKGTVACRRFVAPFRNYIFINLCLVLWNITSRQILRDEGNHSRVAVRAWIDGNSFMLRDYRSTYAHCRDNLRQFLKSVRTLRPRRHTAQFGDAQLLLLSPNRKVRTPSRYINQLDFSTVARVDYGERPAANWLDYVLTIATLSCLRAASVMVSPLKSARARYSLIVYECLLVAQALSAASDFQKTRWILPLHAYHRFTAFLCRCLRSRGNRIIIAPSPNPISSHYKVAFANVFVLTLPYQEGEVRKKVKLHVVDRYLWLRPWIWDCQRPVPLRCTKRASIAVFTRGIWVNDNPLSRSDPWRALEEALLREIAENEYYRESHIELILHPKERGASIAAARSFYSRIFGNSSNLTIREEYDEGNPIPDVAVGVGTSALIECILKGKKSINVDRFRGVSYTRAPWDDPPLSNICVELERLQEVLRKVLSRSYRNYISDFSLQAYDTENFKFYKRQNIEDSAVLIGRPVDVERR